MLGRKQEFNIKINELLDSLLLAIAGVASHSLRAAGHNVPWLQWAKIPPLSSFLWVMVIVVPFTPLILELHGYYKHPSQKSIIKSLQQLLQACIWIGLALGGLALFAKQDIGARGFLPIYAGIGASLLLLREASVRAALKRRARSGEKLEHVLLVGPPQDLEQFLKEMPPEFAMETEIVGRIDITQQPIEDLIQALREKNVERVFFATAHVQFNQIEEAISACEVMGVEVWLSTGFIQTAIAKPTFDTLGNRPMMVFRSTPDISWALFIKDVMDKIGALIGIIILFIPWLFIWLGVRLSSPGAPVIFSQKRSGKYGKPFTMFKFRSMVPDAEAKRSELMSENQMTGPVFKVQHDPRIFAFGRFLRNTSLDETPQLFNVLRGEMSLVGPRPLAYYEAENVNDSAQRRRFSVKPGLTCLWQVSGRNDIKDFADWVRLDLQYIDNWTIWLDIKILILTIPAVLFTKGAK
jgi:exopolysaccharide biosynthesis polyprenyl glycosylphosphotransferase